MFYRRLADLLATRWGQEYSQTISRDAACPLPCLDVHVFYVYPRKQNFCTSSCVWASRLLSVHVVLADQADQLINCNSIILLFFFFTG